MIINEPASIEVIKELPSSDKIIIVDVSGDDSNVIYTYKIPVKIDLRSALEEDISDFSIKLLNKPFDQMSTQTFLELEGVPSNAQDVNSSLETFSEVNMIKFFNRQKDSIVSVKNVDFKELLDKQIMPNFAHLTDEELFGTNATPSCVKA